MSNGVRLGAQITWCRLCCIPCAFIAHHASHPKMGDSQSSLRGGKGGANHKNSRRQLGSSNRMSCMEIGGYGEGGDYEAAFNIMASYITDSGSTFVLVQDIS